MLFGLIKRCTFLGIGDAGARNCGLMIIDTFYAEAADIL